MITETANIDVGSYTRNEEHPGHDPQEILAQSPMGWLQISAVVLCVLLNALDGFDVLAISFAAPGIADEWGIDRAALGIVLSMELIGMSVGSILLGNIADRVGRRPIILGCLILMSCGMLLAGFSNDIVSLSISRLITGLGIGGMLASVSAMVAEFSNAKRRSLSIAIMAAGYSAGAIVGGAIASMLLTTFDWRSVFLLGAFATAIFLPIAWFLLPESISYLAQKRPPNALERINQTLSRMGHRTVAALPVPGTEEGRSGITQLFTPGLARTTMLLTLAYFAHMMTFYFILKWIPKIVADMGFTPSEAGGVLVWASVGGLIGSVILSLLSQRINIRYLVIGALLLANAMVILFGMSEVDLKQLSLVAGMAGFCTNSAIVGLYAIFAQSFPTKLRASGTGFVIGVGRGGAVLGPIITGLLFAGGVGLATVASIMATGALLAALAIILLRKSPQGALS